MKLDFRRVRAGAALTTLALALGAVALGTPPARVDARTAVVAQASGAPQAGPSPVPIVNQPPYSKRLGGGQPTPFPVQSLAPLTGETSLPYPAYGTPVPGVNAGTPAPNVPATITLPQAILIGFARNPALEVARQDINVEAASVRLARAGLLPQIAVSSSLEREYEQAGARGTTGTVTGNGTGGGTTGSTTTTGTTSGSFTGTFASFSGSLSQLIFDGGRIAASVAAARSAEASSVDTYQREMQTIAYNVATAYYNYLAAERTTQVDLENVRDDVVQENLVRAQVAVGTEARSEIATAQLPTAQARLAVVRAQGSELQAEAAFANTMGLDANVRVQPVDDAPVYTNSPVSTIPVVSYDVAFTRAVALRPDYDAEVQLVKQSQSLLRNASLGLFPTLSGSASATDASTDQNLGSFRNSNQIGLSLSVPIYDGGTTSANTQSARANLVIAQANLRSTGLTVSLNIKQALTGLVSARAAFDQTQQEYRTALVNVQATQAQYRAGVTTLPLLLNAEVQLTQALTDQVTAVYTLRQAEQTYLYDVGANYDPTGGARSVSMAYPSVVRPGSATKTRKKRPVHTLL